MPKHPRSSKYPDIQTGRALPTAARTYLSNGANGQPRKDSPELTPRKRLSWKRVVASLLLLVLAAFIFIGSWDAVNVSRAARKTFGSGDLFSLLSSSQLKQQNGRVNILLAGYSVDDPGHPGANLTDSIMLLSLSTTANSGYMLSIPRDLCVDIPGSGYAKINEAYQDGGMNLLEQVVSQDFKVPIDYYAIVDYAAVRDTVNALGGINVDIQSPDPRGLYDPNINATDGGPLKLANGWQTLNGQTALNLVRARGDSPDSYGFPQSDFDRTAHQRQVLVAIKDKLNWTLILNPLKNGKIFSAVGQNVKTDVQLGEARPLFGLFNRIPSANLQSISLNDLNKQNLLQSYITYSGEDALVPAAGLGNYSQIDAAVQTLDQ